MAPRQGVQAVRPTPRRLAASGAATSLSYAGVPFWASKDTSKAEACSSIGRARLRQARRPPPPPPATAGAGASASASRAPAMLVAAVGGHVCGRSRSSQARDGPARSDFRKSSLNVPVHSRTGCANPLLPEPLVVVPPLRRWASANSNRTSSRSRLAELRGGGGERAREGRRRAHRAQRCCGVRSNAMLVAWSNKGVLQPYRKQGCNNNSCGTCPWGTCAVPRYAVQRIKARRSAHVGNAGRIIGSNCVDGMQAACGSCVSMYVTISSRVAYSSVDPRVLRRRTGIAIKWKPECMLHGLAVTC